MTAGEWLPKDGQGTVAQKCYKGIWWGGDEYFYYLNGGDSLTGIYISNFTKVYTLNACSLLHAHLTSMGLLKFR